MWNADPSLQVKYIECCKECLSIEGVFSNFKRDTRYNNIVGMSYDYLGHQLDKYLSQDKTLLAKADIFRKNDSLGSPEVFNFENFGIMSPRTLHHISGVKELKERVGELNNKNILEVGVGFGGLAYIINCFWQLNSYTLIDLPEPTKLAKKCLYKLGVNNILTEPPEVVDLAISEFCFSEFDDNQMMEIYVKYFKGAKSLYLLMNLHDETRKNYWKNIISTDFQLTEYEEFPKSHWPNYVWIGKK